MEIVNRNDLMKGLNELLSDYKKKHDEYVQRAKDMIMLAGYSEYTCTSGKIIKINELSLDQCKEIASDIQAGLNSEQRFSDESTIRKDMTKNNKYGPDNPYNSK